MTPTPSPTHFPLPAAFPPTDVLFYPAIDNAATAPLIFFLPGNPGLINYYCSFLSTLSTLNPSVTIFGASHGGFTPTRTSNTLNAAWAWKWGPGPWGLKQQVEMKRELLLHVVAHLPATTTPRKVLLMAHSMGAYLTLELLSGLPLPATLEVAGGIMLFPTVLMIAPSPQGRVMTPFLRSAMVRGAARTAAWALSWVPEVAVRGVVQVVTGQGVEVAGVTTALVRDSRVVEQVLVLAAEEMAEISVDKWKDEVWNAGGRMVFVFGMGDRWVAEETRMEIMGRSGGAKMVVEERGLPHGFCVRHGEEMAEACGEWIGDIFKNGE